MLDAETLKKVGFHGTMHSMGMCGCPCYVALITVGEALKRETELRVAMAKASPEALAALTIGAVVVDEPDWPVDHAEGE